MASASSLAPIQSNAETANAALKNRKIQPQAGKDVVAAAKDFEALFVSEMFSHMFEGLSADPVFGGGKGENMFRSMLVNEYGKKIANGKGIGISDQLQKTMLEMQQKANGA